MVPVPLSPHRPLPKHTLKGAPGAPCWAGELNFFKGDKFPQTRASSGFLTLPGSPGLPDSSGVGLRAGGTRAGMRMGLAFPSRGSEPAPLSEGSKQAGRASQHDQSPPNCLTLPTLASLPCFNSSSRMDLGVCPPKK